MKYLKRIFGRSKFDRKAHPLVILADKISNKNEKAVESVSLYCESPKKYFDSIDEFERENCFIDSPSDINPAQALSRSLYEANSVVCADNRSEPVFILSSLNELSPAGLDESDVYRKLEKFYSETKYGFGSLVGGIGSVDHDPTIFDCVRSVGLRMLAVNDGSDALILFLCSENDFDEIVDLAKKASVKLYFESM